MNYCKYRHLHVLMFRLLMLCVTCIIKIDVTASLCTCARALSLGQENINKYCILNGIGYQNTFPTYSRRKRKRKRIEKGLELRKQDPMENQIRRIRHLWAHRHTTVTLVKLATAIWINKLLLMAYWTMSRIHLFKLMQWPRCSNIVEQSLSICAFIYYMIQW